jgi:hypothetical protein
MALRAQQSKPSQPAKLRISANLQGWQEQKNKWHQWISKEPMFVACV